MRYKKVGITAICLILAVSSSPLVIKSAVAGEPALVSTMDLVSAVGNLNGFTIAPAKDITAKNYTGDLSPSQVFEIIRPNMQAFSVGRLHSSCTCIMATMEKKDFAAGERAILEVRNVKATPAAGATYAIFVQLNSPQTGALQYDLFVKSGAPVKADATSKASSNKPQVQSAKPPAHTYDDIAPYPKRKNSGAGK